MPEFPLVVENEAFFLGVARRLRHPVARAEVVRDRHGRPGLLVTRFDRVPEGDRLRRVAVEDGAQVLGVHPSDKYTVSMESLATALAGVCRSRPLALLAVLQQAVLAWATGNGDLHAKNVSVLGGVDRQVSPIDDISSTVGHRRGAGRGRRCHRPGRGGRDRLGRPPAPGPRADPPATSPGPRRLTFVVG